MAGVGLNNVLVIVPTRSRPANAIAFAEAFFAHSTRSDLLFALDEDDPELTSYTGVLGVQYEVNPRLRLVGTLNLLANKYCDQYHYLAFMGDDHRIRTPRWDQLLVEAIEDLTAGIAYGNDLLQGAQVPTAVLMNADIIRTLGYMAPPGLIHSFKDYFWRDLGNALSSLRYCGDVVIEHLHVSAGKAADDAVYQESNNPEAVARDQAAYNHYLHTRLSPNVARLTLSLSQEPTEANAFPRERGGTRTQCSADDTVDCNGLLRTDFSEFAAIPVEEAVPLRNEAADCGETGSKPLLRGPVRLLEPVHGLGIDGWVLSGTRIRVIADRALETLTISGRMPWGVGRGAPLLVRLNGTLHATTFNQGSPISWTVPCAVPRSEELVIVFQPGEVAPVPQEDDGDSRALAFLLTDITFRSHPHRGLVHGPVAEIPCTTSGARSPDAQFGPPRISLLCPTRHRPEGVLRLVISALRTAQCPTSLEFVFYVDDDDDTFPSLADLGANARVIRGPRIVMSQMWNQCAGAATGDYLMLIADDFEFRTRGWDHLVREEVDRWPDGIVLVHGNDLSPHGENLATHFVVTRRWIETLGYCVPPYFSCDWVDAWCTAVALHIGRKTYLPDMVIEHHHPAFGKAIWDLSHQERLARGGQEAVNRLYMGLAPLRRMDAEKLKSVIGTMWSRKLGSLGNADYVGEEVQLTPVVTGTEDDFSFQEDEALKLSILICHLPEHAGLLSRLLGVLQPQVDVSKGQVEILIDAQDAVTIGEKRRTLLGQARGEYVVFIEERDMVASDYVARILGAITSSPDAVGIEIVCASYAQSHWSLHSDMNGGDSPASDTAPMPVLSIFNPLRRTVALSAGLPEDIRNKGYSETFSSLVKTETILDGPMYIQL